VIPVPESYVRYIKVGDPVDVHVPSLNRTFPGKVARFSVDVREDRAPCTPKSTFSNPQRVLLPGLYAEAELNLEQEHNVPTVSYPGLDHEGEKTTVFLVGGNGVLEDRAVQVGLETASDVEIVSGLNPGELVVVSDRSGLKPGEKVHPQEVPMLQYHEENTQQ